MKFLKYLLPWNWFKKNEAPAVKKPAPSIEIITPKPSDLNSFKSPWKNESTCIVIDAYYKNPIDWDVMATDKRVVGVIHRSADGLNEDVMYYKRKKIALERGYLWGAYHLGRRGNTIEQAKLFLEMANDDDTLMCLDLEDTSRSTMMTTDEAVVFMNYIYEKTGKVCVVYANHSVTIALNLKLKSNALFSQAKLWYARFLSTIPDFPVGIWSNYFLWQFSSEINCKLTGSCLYNVAGTKYDMDVNVFNGSEKDLRFQWNNKGSVSKIEITPPEKNEIPWLEIAKNEIGQKEISGSNDNPRIEKYHSFTSLKATDDETPWCSSFVSFCLEMAGINSTKNAWARSYLSWGKKITVPVLGCVVIFSRGSSSGHVAFFIKDHGDEIEVLGGNQGNKVCYDRYPKSRLLGYRMPNA